MVGGQTYELWDLSEPELLWRDWVQDALTDRQWQTLYLQVKGYTTAEAARRLGVSRGAVWVYRHRAVKRLRQVAAEM